MEILKIVLHKEIYCKKGKINQQEWENFFSTNNIKIEKVLSSPVCRCWETAKYAGWKYKIDKRLTSNIKNKAKVEKLATKYKGDGNLLLITHMNLIKKLYPWFKVDSGEIVVVDKDLNFIGSIETPYEFTY